MSNDTTKPPKSRGFKELSPAAPQAASTTIQCVPTSRAPRLGRGQKMHGGARKRGDRRSTSLTMTQCLDLRSAALKAIELGMPLNRFATLNFTVLGIDDRYATAALAHFLKLYREWVRRSCKDRAKPPMAALWVREVGKHGNSHVHILLHVPDALKWSGHRAMRWCRRFAPSYRKGAWDSRQVINGWAYHENLSRVVDYILKGGDLKAAHELGLPNFLEGGTIEGKRCSGTRNIFRA
jgi:hypothetical protein